MIEPLRKVASSPDSVASRLASQALQLIGEEVPHKLSQQVPLWTVEDVAHWVSEVGTVMILSFRQVWANSVEPDQTAPRGAV